MPETPKPKPPIHNVYTITLNAQLGDSYQETMLETLINELLLNIEKGINPRHDKNMVIYSVEKAEGEGK